eukprot:COSAG03_NODE_2362_length_2845_cov_20.143481_5_plen_330_part_00
MGRGRPRKGDDAPGGERRAQQRASKARCKALVEAAAATIARESRANRGSVVGSVGAQGHAADREAKAAALDVIARRVVSANPRRVQRGLFAKRELAVGAVHLRYWGAPLTRKEVCPLSLSLVLPSLSLSRSGVCAHVTLSPLACFSARFCLSALILLCSRSSSPGLRPACRLTTLRTSLCIVLEHEHHDSLSHAAPTYDRELRPYSVFPWCIVFVERPPCVLNRLARYLQIRLARWGFRALGCAFELAHRLVRYVSSREPALRAVERAPPVDPAPYQYSGRQRPGVGVAAGVGVELLALVRHHCHALPRAQPVWAVVARTTVRALCCCC